MKSHCAKLTKQEIYHSAQKLKILVIPINSVKDLTEDEQLIYRGTLKKCFTKISTQKSLILELHIK